MKQGICYIVGAGESSRLLLHPNTEDMVIAVDGGYQYLDGQRVDLIVGDFDSLGYVPEHQNVIPLRPEKDDTDMMVALKEGLAAGYRTFYIYGGTGGRISHTIANIQCLMFLAGQGARGYLYDKEEVITLLCNDSLSFDAEAEGYLSVFAYGGKAKGVTLEGLKYELTNATLSVDFPLGVSNEFVGTASKVSVKEGTLLLVYRR